MTGETLSDNQGSDELEAAGAALFKLMRRKWVRYGEDDPDKNTSSAYLEYYGDVYTRIILRTTGKTVYVPRTFFTARIMRPIPETGNWTSELYLPSNHENTLFNKFSEVYKPHEVSVGHLPDDIQQLLNDRRKDHLFEAQQKELNGFPADLPDIQKLTELVTGAASEVRGHRL